MLTHSPLPKDFSLKAQISIKEKGRIRILSQPYISTVNLFTNDVSNGDEDKIITFISQTDFTDNEESIKINEMSFNNGDTTTKQITENNACTLNFNSNSQLTDTGVVKELIAAKKIADCFQIQQGEIISLSMVNLEGCKFSLVSDSPVSFENDNLDLELVHYDNDKEIIAAVKCDTEKEKLRIINCKINESANSKYTFKNRIISDSNKFYAISSDEDNFNVTCKNNKKLIIIIVIVVLCILIIVTVIVIIVICKRRKKMRKNNISLKSLSKKNNILTTSIKLNTKTTETKEDTGEVINLNNNKKKNKNKKSKPKTNKKSKKEENKKSKSKSKKKNKE
jgi:preprotein translocase subunit YajC